MKKPSPDDAALFAAALKDARPLKQRTRRRPAVVEPAAPAAAARAGAAARPSTRKPAKKLPELKPEAGVHPDRATAERMRRGQMAVEATLDLHGMTLARAEQRLANFLVQAQTQGLRLVLVVTGKGTRVDRQTGRIQEGAIRREFPHWLNQDKNRHRIVAFRAAHVRHGGGGAFYVLLKKLRG